MGSTPSVQSFYHPTVSLAIFSFLLTILFLLTISRPPPPRGLFQNKTTSPPFAHHPFLSSVHDIHERLSLLFDLGTPRAGFHVPELADDRLPVRTDRH